LFKPEIALVIVLVEEVTLVAVASPVTALVTFVAVASPVKSDVLAIGERAVVNPALVASGDVAEVTSDVLERVPDVNVASVKLRVAYAQTSDAANILLEVDEPPVIVLVEAYVLFHTSAASAPNDERVLPPADQTCAADRLLSAEIETEVASGEVAEVTPAAVARPEVAVVN
jgi:hypothetical protein